MVSPVVRTRFAPSPTGFMHVGNLRTALYAYLIARSLGGRFILRIEDTDQKRKVEGALDAIFHTLEQVGLRHDEGPDVGGPYEPYVQSQRLDAYKRHAEALVATGQAYYCFCHRDQGDQAEGEIEDGEGGYAGHYNRRCRSLPAAEVERRLGDGMPYAIRQKMPLHGTTVFSDLVFGEIAIDNEELEDQVILKSDGYPTYNFANVIDDHAMAITHVVRGSEYLTSTPKYNLLYTAFGWPVPTYVHLPLILGNDGHKLSKRHGATHFEELVKAGYLPAAIINYIALLGWSPAGTREVFSLDELVQAFSIAGISKSPSIFDYDKLTWFNGEYIRAMAPQRFLDLVRPQLDALFGGRSFDGALLAEMLQPRITRLNQVSTMLRFLVERQEYSLELFWNKKSKADPAIARQVLPQAIDSLYNVPDWNRQVIHDALLRLAAEMDLKTGQLMWPVRIAASGQEVTPGGASEVLALLGRDEALQRLEIGRQRLAAGG